MSRVLVRIFFSCFSALQNNSSIYALFFVSRENDCPPFQVPRFMPPLILARLDSAYHLDMSRGFLVCSPPFPLPLGWGKAFPPRFCGLLLLSLFSPMCHPAEIVLDLQRSLFLSPSFERFSFFPDDFPSAPPNAVAELNRAAGIHQDVARRTRSLFNLFVALTRASLPY